MQVICEKQLEQIYLEQLKSNVFLACMQILVIILTFHTKWGCLCLYSMEQTQMQNYMFSNNLVHNCNLKSVEFRKFTLEYNGSWVASNLYKPNQ